MGNTFKFILEYQDYLENILKLSNKTDRLIYNDLKNNIQKKLNFNILFNEFNKLGN